FVALLIVIVVLMTTGIIQAFVTAAVFGGLILLLTIRDGDGRSVLSRTANRVAWSSTKRRRANLYRSGPLGRSDWGTNQLPGLGAQTRLSEHEDSY
ncbi:SCO6880 family protein, partial [Klebsiella pneumoniae]|uniref:SCO6880 family protein n=1 Tax=Klebsiella pneumoniae TaxID=573 RepID=UPI0038519F52